MSDAGLQYMQVEEQDGVTVVSFHQAQLIDEGTIREIAETLLQFAKTTSPKLLLVLENIDYMASSMLGKLINLQRKARANQGRLALCSILPDTLEVFRVSKLDNYFEIFPDRAAALAALNQPAAK